MALETLVKKDIDIDKVVNEALLDIDNGLSHLHLARRTILTLQKRCIACGQEKELPPALEGICAECEMADFPWEEG